MKTIKFRLLNNPAGTFNDYQTIDQLIGFLSRLRYIKGWTIQVTNGEECLEHSNITDNLPDLHKKLISDMNELIKL